MTISCKPALVDIVFDEDYRDRFLSHTKWLDGCLIWDGAKNTKKGYGRVRINGYEYKAHRVAFHLFRTDLQEGEQLNHTCDVEYCVFWDHMYVGTQLQNIHDAFRRGRIARKLTYADAVTIRLMREEGYQMNWIADHIGCSIATVSLVCSGKIWKEESYAV